MKAKGVILADDSHENLKWGYDESEISKYLGFYTKEKEYYKISRYKLEKDLIVKRNDGKLEELKKD